MIGVALLVLCAWAGASQSQLLVDFSGKTHSIPVKLSANKNPVGALRVGKFYDFNLTQLRGADWSEFDQIQVKVHNPSDATATFFLTLADAQSQDYWSKLNHKSTLAPGWNVLTFSLTQWLGERGSHRHQRSLDLKKLTKFFVHVEGENTSYSIDDIKLLKNPTLKTPVNMKALDFTVDALKSLTALTPVVESDIFDTKKGFGFLPGARFWRSEDAIYAPTSLRSSIGVLEGDFRVDLPNGRYRAELIWNRLGYWDPSFWKRRFVQLNGKPLRLETRTAQAYLKDLLQFQAPSSEAQTLYDTLFSALFGPLEFSFEVTKGQAIFSFEGDASGVSLNRLLVWPESLTAEAQSFRTQLRQAETEQWNQEARRIIRPRGPGKIQGVASAQPRLSVNRALPVTSELRFVGGLGTRPQQLLQLPAGSYTLSVSDWIHADGSRLLKPLEIQTVEAQDVAIDMNHETFERVGKLLSPLKENEFTLSAPVNYLWLTLPIEASWKKGVWKGSVALKAKTATLSFPVTVEVQNYELPKSRVSAGFFHLTPLPPAYFDDSSLKKYHQQIRLAALELMARYGFTAFSALPSDDQELSELLRRAGELGFLTAYTYGGGFLSDATKIHEREAEILNQRVAEQNKKTPKIVLTFSDEATGYQNRLAEDTELRRRLRQRFPKIPLSAFTSMAHEETDDFNQSLNVGFYTKADNWKLKIWQRQGHQWGAYNGAPGNFDDPRFSFGVGLFLASRAGLSHYLEWQSVNNYPYLELDGREGDVTAWLPKADGSVLPTVRFMLAAQGLETYRKLLVIASRAEKEDALGADYKTWLESLEQRYKIFQTERLLKNESFRPEAFERELNEKLKKLI